MPVGDALTRDQRAAVERALVAAEATSGLRFRVHVGRLEDGRASAQALHAAGPDAARTVLVAVDPVSRTLEIVTGRTAAQTVDDRTCGLAALAMTSCFQAGDLVGGIVDGVRLLGNHARAPRSARLG